MKTFMTKAKLRSMFSDAVATGKTLDGALCRLFVNNLVLTDNLNIDDLAAPTFTGYSDSTAIVWGAPLNVRGGVEVPGDAKEFACTGGTPNETVYGYAIITAGGTPALISLRLLDEPVSIGGAGDGLVVVPTVELPNAVEDAS